MYLFQKPTGDYASYLPQRYKAKSTVHMHIQEFVYRFPIAMIYCTMKMNCFQLGIIMSKYKRIFEQDTQYTYRQKQKQPKPKVYTSLYHKFQIRN